MPVQIGSLTAYSVDDIAEMFGLKLPKAHSTWRGFRGKIPARAAEIVERFLVG